MNKVYLCIDLKSFYASCECSDRGLDSMNTNLVVADPTRGKGTICLAVSPSLKALGVKNRCRVYEIPEGIDYIMAKPRMKRYMEVSSLIYSIYLKYVSQEDIHVYSIDECFLDVSDYLSLYEMDEMELAKMIIKDIYDETGIVASCGIGTNLFLTKVALDITAKHSPDHIGYLDEIKFKEELWDHKPLKDFWNISDGISNRLLKYGVDTLRKVTEMDEDILYKEFGINAELLIDHAYGIETTTIADIKAYKSKSRSLTQGQVLFEDYNFKNGLIILKEMVDLIVYDLVEKQLVATGISLCVKYSKDTYKMSGGSRRIDVHTAQLSKLLDYFTTLYNETTSKTLPIRGVSISVSVTSEYNEIISIFDDPDDVNKDRDLTKTIIDIKNKYGANSVLKAMNYQEKATTKERNKFIGGHNSGEN